MLKLQTLRELSDGVQNRQRAIELYLQQFNGHPYLDSKSTEQDRLDAQSFKSHKENMNRELENFIKEESDFYSIPKSLQSYIWNDALKYGNFENYHGCMNIYYRIIQLKNQNLNNKEISITTYFLLILLLLLFIAIAYFFC
jgi:hypothetical protein